MPRFVDLIFGRRDRISQFFNGKDVRTRVIFAVVRQNPSRTAFSSGQHFCNQLKLPWSGYETMYAEPSETFGAVSETQVVQICEVCIEAGTTKLGTGHAFVTGPVIVLPYLSVLIIKLRSPKVTSNTLM